MLAKAALFSSLVALTGCVPGPGGGGDVATGQAIPPGGRGINEYRRDAGIAPVARSSRLDAAARVHANDMAQRRFFGHRGSDGSTHTRRIRAQGCGGGAENLAEGPYDARSVMSAWMGSLGHRANILRPAVTHYGLANAGNKWVLTLSRNCP